MVDKEVLFMCIGVSQMHAILLFCCWCNARHELVQKGMAHRECPVVNLAT